MMGDETMGEIMMNTDGEGMPNHDQLVMMGMSGAGAGLARNTNELHEKLPSSHKG